jgi:hypothetical protein
MQTPMQKSFWDDAREERARSAWTATAGRVAGNRKARGKMLQRKQFGQLEGMRAHRV